MATVIDDTGAPFERSTADMVPVTTVLCDLDGVVWLAHVPIEGAPDAVARLRASGRRVLFVTNNSASTVGEQERALDDIGIRARGDVVTSAMAAALLVQPGERVLVCGGPGVSEAVEVRGGTPVRDGPCEAVIVGFHRDFDYERLRAAATAVRSGARLIGTNDDPTYPTPDGPIPGGGSLLAAVAVASGATPTVAGKPHPPMAALVREVVGPSWDPAATWMVGDRFSTDGRFADEVGCRFARVGSGVPPPGSARGGDGAFPPVVDVADLAAVADSIVRTSRAR
jgi:HAD superfamily hydrolase (TIGR01450 family)